MDQPLRVLFVDDHDATRSRMAAGILRAQGGEDFEVSSAGTAPRAIDPHTLALLRLFEMDPGAEQGTPVQAYAGERSTISSCCATSSTTSRRRSWRSARLRSSGIFPSPPALQGDDERQDPCVACSNCCASASRCLSWRSTTSCAHAARTT